MNGKNILVVEDNPSLLAGIRGVLEVEGYDVLTATNGVEALNVLQEYYPHLIVADIMMPQMDGYALYEAVRNRPEWTPIPFVFLTAKATREDVLRGKALGVEEYITKPFDPQELVVTVRARLDRAQAIQEVSEAKLDELKRQIATALGHELRTPLTYVRGYTDLALENVPMLAPDELEQFLHGIKFGADRLTRLVEDLLVLVQLDTGQMTKDFMLLSEISSDMDIVVAHAVQTRAGHAAAQGLALVTQVQPNLPPILLCESQFVNVLDRLIDNAIKFSRAKGEKIVVSAGARDGWIEVSVADEGIGIAPDQIPHLFQRFRQIDRDNLEQQGLGLGLAIAWELIQLQGGDITVESQLKRGSTFTIRLPVAREPQRPAGDRGEVLQRGNHAGARQHLAG